MLLAEIAKNAQKDVVVPVSNNIQIVRDIVQENFKSVKFTLNGVSSNCSSSALNVIKMSEKVDKALAEIQSVKDSIKTITDASDSKAVLQELTGFV